MVGEYLNFVKMERGKEHPSIFERMTVRVSYPAPKRFSPLAEFLEKEWKKARRCINVNNGSDS